MLPSGFTFEILKKENRSDYLFCQAYLEEAWKEPVETILDDCCLHHEGDFCLLLKREDAPIGLIIYQYKSGLIVKDVESPVRGWLKGFYIEPEYRKTGLAQKLFDKCISRVEVDKLHLGVNFIKPKLYEWYTSRGWHDTGMIAYDVTGDHHVLVKDVKEFSL